MWTTCINQIIKVNDHLDNEFLKIIQLKTHEIKSILLESQNAVYRNITSELSKMNRNDGIKLEYDGTEQIKILLDAQSLIIQELVSKLQSNMVHEMKRKMTICHQHYDGMNKISQKYGLKTENPTKLENTDLSSNVSVEEIADSVFESAMHAEDEATESEEEVNRVDNVSSRQKLYVPGINLICKQCDELFYFSMDYPNHMKFVHGVDKPFECDQCDSSFKLKKHLNNHIRSVHEKVVNYRCSYCSRGFYYKGDLTNHLRVHTGEKPFQCKLCGKAFKENSNYLMHVRTVHSDERPFECSHCDASFKLKHHLENHMALKHQIGVKHRCSHCSKGFYRKDSLTKHLRVHTGERPFQCKVCSKAFKERSHLTVHERIHSGEKPCECPKCHRTFRQSGAMRTHEKKCNG